MSTPNASMNFQCQSNEVLSAADAAAVGQNSVALTAFNAQVALNSASATPVTVTCFMTATLVAGALVVDLTAAPKSIGSGTQDLTGKKLIGLILNNPAGNHAVTIGPDATNGYQLFGGTNTVTVPAGTSVVTRLQLYFGTALPAVGGSAKRIDLSGTGTESFQLGMLFG